MLEIKIGEWGNNRLRLILAPIDSLLNPVQKPINDYFRPFDVTNIFIILILNFTQVLINHFHFVINKNNSQLNALKNLNDSCFLIQIVKLFSIVNFLTHTEMMKSKWWNSNDAIIMMQCSRIWFVYIFMDICGS